MKASRPDPGAASESNITTGIPAAIARLITGTTALPSTAEIASPSTWRWIRLSSTWICGWISVTVGPVYSHVTPSLLASAWHPSRTKLKNGLLIAFGTTANVIRLAPLAGAVPSRPAETAATTIAKPTPRQMRMPLPPSALRSGCARRSSLLVRRAPRAGSARRHGGLRGRALLLRLSDPKDGRAGGERARPATPAGDGP